ncbi:3-ketoacyl-CoA thiolase [compost metagenome]
MKSPRDVVLVDGIRTPFTKAGTKLKKIHPADLGKVALQQLIAATNLNVESVDEVIIGNTGNPPDAVNIALWVLAFHRKFLLTQFIEIVLLHLNLSRMVLKKLNQARWML